MTSHMIHTATQLIALEFGVLKHAESRPTAPFGVLIHVAAHLTHPFGVWIHVSTIFAAPFGVLMHAASHLAVLFGVSPTLNVIGSLTTRVILCLSIRMKRSLKSTTIFV